MRDLAPQPDAAGWPTDPLPVFDVADGDDDGGGDGGVYCCCCDDDDDGGGCYYSTAAAAAGFQTHPHEPCVRL